MSQRSATTYITTPVEDGDPKALKAAKEASREEAKKRLQCEEPRLLEGSVVRTKDPIPKSEENPLGHPGTFEYRATWINEWEDSEPGAATLVSKEVGEPSNGEKENG